MFAMCGLGLVWFELPVNAKRWELLGFLIGLPRSGATGGETGGNSKPSIQRSKNKVTLKKQKRLYLFIYLRKREASE